MAGNGFGRPEPLLESGLQRGIDLRHRNRNAEVDKAGDAVAGHPARNDPGIVLEIRIDVQADAVEGDPAADADADRRDLVLRRPSVR